MAKILFRGIVKAGEFRPDQLLQYQERMKKLEGRRVIQSTKREQTKATLDQHGYYRASVLPEITEACGGDPHVEEDLWSVHTGLKIKFGGLEERRGGLMVVASHADYDVEEMSRFLDFVLRFAAVDLGIYLSPPRGKE